jgi:prepilin-type N-terminal cleavage/methylation domain-containing protein
MSFPAQKGFSVIELMIVLLLMGMVFAKGIPFTLEWVNSARVTDAESALIEGVGFAKAKALRNGNGVIEGRAVTALCYNQGQFSIYEGEDNAKPAACDVTLDRPWVQSIASNIDIKVANSAFSCICFDAKAQITLTGSCALCASSTTFDIALGNQA